MSSHSAATSLIRMKVESRQPRLARKKPVIPPRDVWAEYERRKAEIAATAATQDEYDARLGALIAELKI